MATYTGWKYKLLEMRHRAKELLLTVQIACKSSHMQKPVSDQPLLIAMVDGESFHGGMCDRFKGIISLYAYCKLHQLPFRIRYTYPFRLEEFLIPADYDWTLHPGEYTDNPLFIRVLYMRGEHYATRLLRLRPKRQIHFYTNRDLLPHINEAFHDKLPGGEAYDWGALYRELFKPGKELQEHIDRITGEIGGEYDALVFRFQNLLGDFKEYHYKALEDKSEAEQLLEKCIGYVQQRKKVSSDKKLLVTSDSTTFLKWVSQIQGVYVIPGTLTHMDGAKLQGDQSKAHGAYMKSFLDFYMISKAQRVYRVGTEKMFNSAFPVFAAKINERPFESITL